MDRRLFMNRFARWTVLLILAGITFLLRHKIVRGRNCSSCPEYASCSGLDYCNTDTGRT